MFVLFLIAVYAPLLSLNQPFFWRTGGTWSAPFFPALFNRLLFENGIDIFFNLLLVLSPIYVASRTWSVLSAASPERSDARLGARRINFTSVLFAVVAPAHSRVLSRIRSTARDERRELPNRRRRALRAAGRSVRRRSFRRTATVIAKRTRSRA